MSPYLQLVAKYAKHPQEHPFGWYISYYLENGYVFNTPDFFIMGAPILRPPLLDRDTWLIHSMSGSMEKAWSVLPYELPYFAFERFDQDLRFYPVSEIRRFTAPDRHTEPAHA